MALERGEEYIGSLKKGVFHGKAPHFVVSRRGQGTRTWPNGDRYAGSFKHGLQDGEAFESRSSRSAAQGTFESAEEGWVYTGQWLQNRMKLGADLRKMSRSLCLILGMAVERRVAFFFSGLRASS